MSDVIVDKDIQLLNLDDDVVKFQVPSSLSVSGPSQSG